MEQDGQCRDFLQRTIQLQMYHHIGAIFRIRVAIVTMTAIMARVFIANVRAILALKIKPLPSTLVNSDYL